jgi:HK97 family phage major capsid protein
MKLKFPFLSATLALLASVAIMYSLSAINSVQALGLLFSGQIALLCFSKPRPALFLGVLSPHQIEEFEEITHDLAAHWTSIKELPERVRALEKNNDELRGELRKQIRRAVSGTAGTGVHWVGNQPFVTNDCARALTSVFVLEVATLGEGGLTALVRDPGNRERVLSLSKQILGIETRAALTTTEIPVPTVYVPQIIELVYAYGQARQFATVFPLGAGTVKLPRLKAGEDDFGYLGAGTAGMSQSITERKVTAELVTFTANKAGGLIRIPTELEEDTFVPIGQFLARYIARQLAKLEDKTLFIGDGTSTYANITGIGTYCDNNTSYRLQLAGGKTKPSDATLDDFRNLRALVNPAILGNMAAGAQTSGAYYLHPSYEPFLRSFNKYPNFVVYENVNGKPTFDGWPVRWIGVSQPYGTAAAAATYMAFFGDLSYWYLGERGSVRVEVSKEVFFATDELAMRALERIDVEGMAIDAMATMKTAAA